MADPFVGEPPRLGLYVAWPRPESPQLHKALDLAAERAAATVVGRPLAAVMIGTAEPSSVECGDPARVMNALRATFELASDIEVTLLGAPLACTAPHLALWRDAGVTRLSVRIDDALCDATRADLARACTVFPHVGVDVALGWHGQTTADLRATLRQLTDLGVDHVGLNELDDDDPGNRSRADLMDSALAALDIMGLTACDLANHARAGADCRYLAIVRDCGDHLGIGPGAAGRLTGRGHRLALRQITDPTTWRANVESGGDGMAELIVLTPNEVLTELLAVGAASRDGIARTNFRRLLKTTPEAVVDLADAHHLVDDGLIVLDANGLRVPEMHWPRATGILTHLLPGDDRSRMRM